VSVLEQNPYPLSSSQVMGSPLQLAKNPTLPDHPLGAYTDAQYEAEMAKLRAQTSRTYADILQKLGFMDDKGQFIPGSIETGAWRDRLAAQRGQGLAIEGVTNEAQRGGTLFSGLRADNQARAEHPFVQAMADLDVNTPLALSEQYRNAGTLMEDYQIGQNSLLASAAQRRSASLMDQAPPAYDDGSGGASEVGGPVAGPTPNMLQNPAAMTSQLPYNPRGYVPGGALPSVAKAIVKKAQVYNPYAYVRGGASTPAMRQVAAQTQRSHHSSYS
jgi:hypothetical protein